MAKLTALQALNEVLKRIGEAQVSVLTSLTTIQQVAFDNLNKGLEQFAQDIQVTPLETQGSITLDGASSAYSYPTGFMSMVYDSMRTVDGAKIIQYLSPDSFDAKFPDGVTQRFGLPEWYTINFGKIQFDRTSDSGTLNMVINYRYFALPTLYSTATPSGTSFMPEQWDNTLLCDWATWRTMSYMGHQEEMKYYAYVFGGGQDNAPEGELTMFKRKYAQPPLRTVRFAGIL